MTLTIFDAIGILGVILILTTYLALQLERIAATNWRFSALNAVGAGCILISLYFEFNLSAALIEMAWLFISLFGIFKALKIGGRT